jgi:hypothetical protein
MGISGIGEKGKRENMKDSLGDAVIKSLDVPPFMFLDALLNRWAYVYPDTKHWTAGWLLKRTANGEWITVRKATDADIEDLARAAISAHHEED